MSKNKWNSTCDFAPENKWEGNPQLKNRLFTHNGHGMGNFYVEKFQNYCTRHKLTWFILICLQFQSNMEALLIARVGTASGRWFPPFLK
jgi:hypothetical protein